MKYLYYTVMLLAGFGFSLTLAATIAAWSGVSLINSAQFGYLFVGIFVVWLPTVLIANRMVRFGNRRDFWKITLSGCPQWMRQALYVVFGYAVVNFLLLIMGIYGSVHSGSGPPFDARTVSGHVLAFYGAAFAVSYSALHAPYLLKERKCPEGHTVSPTDEFCPKCGRPIIDNPNS